METTQTLHAKFFAIGKAAFAAGQPAAPALNPEVMAQLADAPVGNPATKIIMKAFSAGWTNANLEVPVA